MECTTSFNSKRDFGRTLIPLLHAIVEWGNEAAKTNKRITMVEYE
ncbi:hypothetical protein FM120_20305 [Sphingobacterium faecium PCAi_F2.5]|nr:hypothetical protein FM120_20305 [Sphingobacterium faecium PCAi_F2.5]